MQREKAMCTGCGFPRAETFDPKAEDRYDVTTLTCHACAARERRAWNKAAGRDADQPPPFGEFYAVTPSDD
jgi:ribosomal protein L37E